MTVPKMPKRRILAGASVTWNEWGAQSICICETNAWGKSPKEKFQRNPRGKMKKEE